MKVENISHMSNVQPFSFPVRSMTRRVAHLIQHKSPATIPLYVYFDEQGQKRLVTSSMITSLLWMAALTIPGHDGVNPDKIAARLLQSSGAIALLLVGVDTNHIRILGFWKSDAMLCYLYNCALALIKDNSKIMFQGGHYTLVTQLFP